VALSVSVAGNVSDENQNVPKIAQFQAQRKILFTWNNLFAKIVIEDFTKKE
jgi:hypothetical protein